MSRAVLLAVLSAVFAPAATNSGVLAQKVGGCTTSSLTLPGWLVQGLQSSKAPQLPVGSADVSFQLLNRATNVSVELSCSGSVNGTLARRQGPQDTGKWIRCSSKSTDSTGKALDVSVQLNETSARLRINETWSCGDLSADKPIVFTAIGRNSSALSCSTAAGGAVTCKSKGDIPLLVRGSLLSPVQITPNAVAGPTGHDNAGCAAISKYPAWELSGTQYNLQTQYNTAGAMTSHTESLGLQLANNVTGYITSCSGFLATGTGLMRFSCFAQEAYRRGEKYNIQTDAVFDPQTHIISVNETWFCDDTGPATPVSITAGGSAKIPFDCMTFPQESETGLHNTTYCTTDPVHIAASPLSQQVLPPYALKDPLPTTDSCTVSSILSPTWMLSDFETVSEAGSAGTIKFNLDLQTSPGPIQYPTTFNQIGIQLSTSAEPRWYPCTFEQLVANSGCTFRYDPAGKSLSIRNEWPCSDLDADHPITFTGTINTTIPSLTCKTEGGSTRCATPEGKTWTASTSLVKWF